MMRVTIAKRIMIKFKVTRPMTKSLNRKNKTWFRLRKRLNFPLLITISVAISLIV